MRYREVVRPEAERERERGRRDAPGSRVYPLIGVLPNERKRGVVDDWRGGGTAQHALDRRERDVPRMRAKRRAGYRSPTWVRDAMQSHAPRVSPETRSVLRGNASRGRRVARHVARLRRRHGGGDARRRVRTARRRRTFSFSTSEVEKVGARENERQQHQIRVNGHGRPHGAGPSTGSPGPAAGANSRIAEVSPSSRAARARGDAAVARCEDTPRAFSKPGGHPRVVTRNGDVFLLLGGCDALRVRGFRCRRER